MSQTSQQFALISIHASAKEATNYAKTHKRWTNNFNPRLREGGDVNGVWNGIQSMNFNPRLREGGDMKGGY